MIRMYYTQFENNEHYNYIATIHKEINSGNILGLYQHTVSFISIFATTTYLSYLLYELNILAVILSLLCCLPGFIHQTTFGKKNWEFNTSKIPLQRKTGYYFQLLSSLNPYLENRIYGTISKYKDEFEELHKGHYKELKEFNKENCYKGIVMATIHSLGTVLVIAYAYNQAAKGTISLGDAVLFVGISQSIYNNVQNGIYTFGAMNESRRSIHNILGFIEGGNEKLLNKKECLEKIESKNDDTKEESLEEQNLEVVDMTLSGVSFAYPSSDKEVLSNLNLSIKKGEKLAIVGENGSGKTTLVKLLLGIYHPKKGEILLNTKNLRDYSDNIRYGTVAFQDYYTYSFSIRENIAFGNMEKLSDDKSIQDAIEKSQLDKSSYGDNIESQVTKTFDSNGIVFSGGQTQKLSLARAFLYEKGLLILDEASAALDAKTEHEIFQSTLALMKARTTVLITHRLSNVVHCDRIVYLESGKICEEGSHEELLSLNGRYAKLFRIQSEKYIVS